MIKSIDSNQESYTEEENPTTNFGSSSNVFVGFESGGIFDHFGWFGFDMASVPVGATISAVTFNFTINASSSTGGNFELRDFTDVWDEDTITWNTQPTVTNAVVGSLSLSALESGAKSISTPDLISIINGLRPSGQLSIRGDFGLGLSFAIEASSIFLDITHDLGNIKISPDEGSIDKAVTRVFIANDEGSINKQVIGIFIAPDEGAIDKQVL
jgi:hypothetical protein